MSSKNNQDLAGVTLLIDDNEGEKYSSTSSLMVEDEYSAEEEPLQPK